MIHNRRGFGIQWPDKREALIHLTKNALPRTNLPGNFIPTGNAYARLINILQTGEVRATFVNHMDYLHPNVPFAVAFSEALPTTVQMHVQRGSYSPYGIMVHKETVLTQNGGAVWYVQNNEFKALTGDRNVVQKPIPQDLRFLLSPYAPIWSIYRSHANTPIDWTQEREWRTPQDFQLPFRNGRADFYVIVSQEEEIEAIMRLGLAGIQREDIRLINDIPDIW